MAATTNESGGDIESGDGLENEVKEGPDEDAESRNDSENKTKEVPDEKDGLEDEVCQEGTGRKVKELRLLDSFQLFFHRRMRIEIDHVICFNFF